MHCNLNLLYLRKAINADSIRLFKFSGTQNQLAQNFIQPYSRIEEEESKTKVGQRLLRHVGDATSIVRGYAQQMASQHQPQS